MNAIGATAVVVTAVGNDLKLWMIINFWSTIILWWSLFYLKGHEKTRRNKQTKINSVQFCESLRTKWTGFICRRMKPVRQRMKPVRQRMKPFILVLIFFSYVSPLPPNVFFLSAAGVVPSESALKTVFFWEPLLIYWTILLNLFEAVMVNRPGIARDFL